MDITIKDHSKGVIATEPIEVHSGKMAWVPGDLAPYPIVKFVFTVNSIGKNKTEVKEKLIFLKGAAWRKGTMKKESVLLFRKIHYNIRRNKERIKGTGLIF